MMERKKEKIQEKEDKETQERDIRSESLKNWRFRITWRRKTK